MNALKIIAETGLVAILRGFGHNESLKAAEALVRGGVKALEVTYNTPGAEAVLKELVKEFGQEAVVGAGTVMTTENLRSAIDSGASFILAPNFEESIVKETIAAGLLAIPGAFTATEVAAAHRSGAGMIKIFPVSSVGPQYIKDLRGPLNNIPLMPVGGVDLQNAADFIRAGSAALGVGGSLLKKELVAENRLAELTKLAEDYLRKILEARQLDSAKF